MKYFILFISLVITINLNAQLFGGMIISKAATCEAVTDYDGNTYDVVDINGQCWITENLKTTHYNDGTSIPNVTNSTTWFNLSTDAWAYYNNDANYNADYGKLYNGHAVETGKLCPTGWHVPTDAEWSTLTTYLGGGSVAGGKLKEVGFEHWDSPNTGATDEVGFTALPGGYRSPLGSWLNIRDAGYWWSATPYSSNNRYYRYIYRDDDIFGSNNNRDNRYGKSVRCLKD